MQARTKNAESNSASVGWAEILEQVRKKRESAAAQVAALDTVIAAMTPLMENTAVAVTTARRAKPTRRSTKRQMRARPVKSQGSGPTDEDIRIYLTKHNGSVSTGEFAAHFGLNSYRRTLLTDDLSRRGIITVTGVTLNRRVSLAVKSPAKEAVQRPAAVGESTSGRG